MRLSSLVPAPPRRTLRATIGRLLLVRSVIWVLVCGMFVVGHNFGATLSSDSLPRPVDRTPAWSASDARDFPGCVPMVGWSQGEVPDSLVVERYRDDRHLRLDFDRAWRINHNATQTDDVHVLGACA